MSHFSTTLKNLITSTATAIKNLRASETKYGFSRKATEQELENGVTASGVAFITPELLKLKLDALPDYSEAANLSTSLGNEFRAADAAIRTDFVAADTQIREDYKAADTQLKRDIYDEIAGAGQEGEILSVKYNTTTSRNEITSIPLISYLNITTNQEELDAQKLEPVGMQEIFNTWYRFSHWWGEQNLNSGHHTDMRNSWTYDPATSMIISNRNSPVYSAFIHPKKLSNWYLKVKADGNGDGDNDGILICCAFMTDSNGVEHTIDLIRARAGVGNGVAYDSVGMQYYWSLIYDYRLNTQFELANNTYIQPVGGGWGWNTCLMSCKRTMTTLTCYTSQFNASDIDLNSKIEFSLPTTKPSNWSDEMWTNMNIMLNSPAQMGVGAHSQMGRFTILEQKYIFADQKIYDMLNDAIWEYKESTSKWNNIGKISSLLQDGTMYFNKKTNRLLYYSNNEMSQLNNVEVVDTSSFRVGLFESQSFTKTPITGRAIRWSYHTNGNITFNNTWLGDGFTLTNDGVIKCPKAGLMYISIQLAFAMDSAIATALPIELAVNQSADFSANRVLQISHNQASPLNLSGIIYVTDIKSLWVELSSELDSFTFDLMQKKTNGIASRESLPLSFFSGYYV